VSKNCQKDKPLTFTPQTSIAFSLTAASLRPYNRSDIAQPVQMSDRLTDQACSNIATVNHDPLRVLKTYSHQVAEFVQAELARERTPCRPELAPVQVAIG
jgi:hypothetical protein